eukprot:SAG31_NODE_5050_length_2775_cov_2.843423_2_plen_193_part_00
MRVILVADVARGRWLDECCRPIKLSWFTLFEAKHQFLASAVVELEASAPETVTAMLEQCMVNFGRSEDGTQAISLRSGTAIWDSATRPMGLTPIYENVVATFDSAAAVVVSAGDAHSTATQPYSRVLPTVILDYIAANPTSLLAERFRLFARHALVHGMRQISGLLEAHAAVVEPPSVDWCANLSRFLRSKS